MDRFRVVVFPVITGSSGRERIYDGYPDVALDMISSRTFDGRIQLLEYVPTILSGPPGTTRATPEAITGRGSSRVTGATGKLTWRSPIGEPSEQRQETSDPDSMARLGVPC